MSNELAAAKSILTKLSTGYFSFEVWPTGDGMLIVDGNTDLTKSEVAFLSTFLTSKAEGGPGGLPVDWGEEEE